jgi:hypothetical protein
MKMSTQLTLFFVAFNALAGIFIGMGVAADLGLNVQTGDPGQFDEITDQDDVRMGNSVGGTLFGMYNVLTQQAATIFYSAAPGFAMLRNFLPNIWIDVFLSPVASIVVTKDIIAFARGDDL